MASLDDSEAYYPYSPEPRNAADDTASFGSRLGLVENSNKYQRNGYNFDPIDGRPDNELVVMEPLANVSAISQSTATQDDHSLHSIDSVAHSHLSRQPEENQLYGCFEDDRMDSLLLNRKRANQRIAREQLVLDVIDRLQDDPKIVAELEELHETDEPVVNSWFAKTNLNRDGLLTGYSEKKRSKLLSYTQSIINEMNTARPEEFFLSPTQIPDIADTHDDLRNALLFVQKAVRLAVPDKEKRWHCRVEMRSAMGIPTTPMSKFFMRFRVDSRQQRDLTWFILYRRS